MDKQILSDAVLFYEVLKDMKEVLISSLSEQDRSIVFRRIIKDCDDLYTKLFRGVVYGKRSLDNDIRMDYNIIVSNVVRRELDFYKRVRKDIGLLTVIKLDLLQPRKLVSYSLSSPLVNAIKKTIYGLGCRRLKKMLKRHVSDADILDWLFQIDKERSKCNECNIYFTHLYSQKYYVATNEQK